MDISNRLSIHYFLILIDNSTNGGYHTLSMVEDILTFHQTKS